MSCLRQLLQQETKEVREHIKPLVPSGLIEMRELEGKKQLCLPETGLEGALFEMLDTEMDLEMRQYIKVILLLKINDDHTLIAIFALSITN